MINTCIIPAAGKGSRWAPISGYLPKEMLPLVDRPVIDWVVREAIDSGCKRIIIVTNKQKKIIKEYFEKEKTITKQAQILFVNQEQPLGITHALSLCQKYIGDSSFGVALPDLPTISHIPVLKQLIKAYNSKDRSHIISFNSFPIDTLQFYTECLSKPGKDKTLDVIHFCPSRGKTPHHPNNRTRMSGRYILDPSIFEIFEKLLKNNKKLEVKEYEALKEALKSGHKILGLNIQGHTYDTGNPISYIRANTAFFKKRLAKHK